MLDNGSDSNVLFTGENYVSPNNRTNAGTYRCTADNGIENAVNHTVNVTVHCEYHCPFKRYLNKTNLKTPAYCVQLTRRPPRLPSNF